MSTEFMMLGPNIIRSAKGFTLHYHSGGHGGAVDYSDGNKKVRVVIELFGRPRRYGVYASSEDLKKLTSYEAEEILDGVKRALEYLGHPAEIVRW